MTRFAKLNLKDQKDIVIENAPASFEAEIASLKGVTVRRSMSDTKQVEFSTRPDEYRYSKAGKSKIRK